MHRSMFMLVSCEACSSILSLLSPKFWAYTGIGIIFEIARLNCWGIVTMLHGKVRLKHWCLVRCHKLSNCPHYLNWLNLYRMGFLICNSTYKTLIWSRMYDILIIFYLKLDYFHLWLLSYETSFRDNKEEIVRIKNFEN